MSGPSGTDCAVVGGGVMGCATALFLARGGMRVTLVERGGLCREASGVNAGTLTMQMTRAPLIPYALRGFDLWQRTAEWLDADVGMRALDGLSVAFDAAEAAMLQERAGARREAGAAIELVGPARARTIEPGLTGRLELAAHCPVDGFAVAYLTGLAFRRALLAAGVAVLEHTPVEAVEAGAAGFQVRAGGATLSARRLVLAGGVWLEEMLAWLGVSIRVQCLVNQLVITERTAPVMRTILGVANGKLSLKQLDNGTVLIGGGWQGIGDVARGGHEIVPENVIGNLRLAVHTVPALREARVVRCWLGLEAETDDAMPLLGPVPGVDGAFVIGSAHSGYTSGPFMGRLLADRVLGREPALPLFDPGRLVRADGARTVAPGDAAA